MPRPGYRRDGTSGWVTGIVTRHNVRIVRNTATAWRILSARNLIGGQLRSPEDPCCASGKPGQTGRVGNPYGQAGLLGPRPSLESWSPPRETLASPGLVRSDSSWTGRTQSPPNPSAGIRGRSSGSPCDSMGSCRDWNQGPGTDLPNIEVPRDPVMGASGRPGSPSRVQRGREANLSAAWPHRHNALLPGPSGPATLPAPSVGPDEPGATGPAEGRSPTLQSCSGYPFWGGA